MPHPLTTAQIKKLARKYTLNVESGEYSFGEDTVRAAYDLALDRCIERIDAVDCDAQQETAQRLRKERRPQQQAKQKPFRPPIGIEPDFIWKTKRLHELVLAASRFIEAGKGVKTAWLLEIHTLIGDLHIYQQQKQQQEGN